jgi:hypothetical protein
VYLGHHYHGHRSWGVVSMLEPIVQLHTQTLCAWCGAQSIHTWRVLLPRLLLHLQWLRAAPSCTRSYTACNGRVVPISLKVTMCVHEARDDPMHTAEVAKLNDRRARYFVVANMGKHEKRVRLMNGQISN